VSRAGDIITEAANALRAGNYAPNTANDLLLDVKPVVERLAAALAEVKQFAPATDPARVEAEAALRQYREGVA
jgi:hypothetical protein